MDTLLQYLFRKNSKLVLISVVNPGQSLLDCPAGVGKALVFTALYVILHRVRGVEFGKSSF